MVAVNRMTTPANMRWKLIDRETGAENAAIDWQFQVGDQVKIRLLNEMAGDHPMHHPFHVHGAGRFLVLARDGVAEPNLVWKDTVLVRTGETVDILLDVTNVGRVDGALPHRRAPRERDDVQLRRRPGRRRRSEHMTADAAGDRRDVIVVGGGQAGLAIGYLLAQQGRRFTILEAADTPAAAWRERWDSLRLFTPVRYDSLPGRAFPGDPDSYPGRDDVVAYLTDYARDFELPVELSSRVRAVRQGERGYLVELDDRSYEADQVVIATGPFQIPRVPAIAERLDPGIMQFHSSKYRGPQDVPAGPVLVVGGGNTGYQIAEELARTHEVHLSIGARQTPLPQRILGRDLFRYLEATGLMGKTVESRIGQRMQHRETLIGSSPRAARRRHGIELRGRTVDVSGSEVRFSDGGRLSPGAVIWATGFELDHSFVQLPVFDDGRPPRAPARRHRIARAVLPRTAVAAHARLGAAGLGQGRRRAHRAAHLGTRSCAVVDGAGMTVVAPGGSPATTPTVRVGAVAVCGLGFGALQAASPLAFWWLDAATVYALGLVLIASVYIGFAVADGRWVVIAVEIGVASVFVVVAAAAITGSAWLLVAGLVGHGLKDLWQHRSQFVANTRWWPPFCLVVDVDRRRHHRHRRSSSAGRCTTDRRRSAGRVRPWV